MQKQKEKAGYHTGEMVNSKRKFKRFHNRLKFIMILVLFFLIIALLAMTPLFNIRDIEVYGNKHYDSSAIIGITGIQIGANGFKAIGQSLMDIVLLRHTQAEMNIVKNCHYIKEAVVKYMIPNKIKITVLERTPMAFVPFLGTSLLMDNEGYIIDAMKDKGTFKLPEIRGLKFGYFELGQKISVDDFDRVEDVVKIINALSISDKEDDNFKIMGLINSIDMSDSNSICLFIDSRIVAKIGYIEELDYKIRILKHIYYKNIRKEDKGILDFTRGQNPVFIPES